MAENSLFPHIPGPKRTHPALELLERAHPPEQAAAIFEEKVRRKPLLLLPGDPDPESKDARAARRRKRLRKQEHRLRKQKPRPLSAKQRRKLCIHAIPSDDLSRRWTSYLPLRELWWGYIRDILDVGGGGSGDNGGSGKDPSRDVSYVTGMSVGPRLAAADFHGAELCVVRSNCVSRVGVAGIVLKDTKFTFEMITPRNELKTVPKARTVFRFEVPRGPLKGNAGLKDVPTEEFGSGEVDTEMANDRTEDLKPFVFELHGSQFEVRAADRATKKFKAKRMEYL